MRKERAMPQTVLLIPDDGAKARRVKKERAQVTLDSIDDAVGCTDVLGNVTFLNPIAEALTGWLASEAVGPSFAQVSRIIDASDHRRAVDPMALVVNTNKPINRSQLDRNSGWELMASIYAK
jgi:PAS domain-containing protein